jgi:hypothetical protein
VTKVDSKVDCLAARRVHAWAGNWGLLLAAAMDDSKAAHLVHNSAVSMVDSKDDKWAVSTVCWTDER